MIDAPEKRRSDHSHLPGPPVVAKDPKTLARSLRNCKTSICRFENRRLSEPDDLGSPFMETLFAGRIYRARASLGPEAGTSDRRLCGDHDQCSCRRPSHHGHGLCLQAANQPFVLEKSCVQPEISPVLWHFSLQPPARRFPPRSIRSRCPRPPAAERVLNPPWAYHPGTCPVPGSVAYGLPANHRDSSHDPAAAPTSSAPHPRAAGSFTALLTTKT